MTYGFFLLIFVVAPSLVIFGILAYQRRITRRWVLALAATCVLAVAYTTPWDNLLVASNVWSYPPERVMGIVWGYVPIEEYSFFVLETIFVALIVLAIAPRFRYGDGGTDTPKAAGTGETLVEVDPDVR